MMECVGGDNLIPQRRNEPRGRTHRLDRDQWRALLRRLACCASLLSAPGYAVVIDFETLADGKTPTVAAHSASAEYAALGVIFSGGGGFPGQPLFRGWSSLSRFIAHRPPPENRTLLSTFRGYDEGYLDIVLSFTTPASYAAGDVVFNPTLTAEAIAYDGANVVIGEQHFLSGSPDWIAGRFSFSSGAGIAKILLRTSVPEAQMGLDNLWFTPVPEPASAAWLINGIAALVVLAGLRRHQFLRSVTASGAVP